MPTGPRKRILVPGKLRGINGNQPIPKSTKPAKKPRTAATKPTNANPRPHQKRVPSATRSAPNLPDQPANPLAATPTEAAPQAPSATQQPRPKSKRPKHYRGFGRPAKYNPSVASEVCRLMATGLSLKKVCERRGMPNMYTVFHWQFTRPDFGNSFARAQMDRAQVFGEEIIEIADDGTNDWVEKVRRDGSVVLLGDHEHIQRSKLRVDARKWLMAKLDPKRWGEKIQISGDADNPLQHIVRDLGREQRPLTAPELAALEHFARARLEASEAEYQDVTPSAGDAGS